MCNRTKMNKIGFIFLLIELSFYTASTENVVSYANYKVYTVAEEGLSVPALRMPENRGGFSVLTEHNVFDSDNNPYTLRSYLISQEAEKPFRKALKFSRAKYNVSIDDLGKEIEEEKRSNENFRRTGSSGLGIVWETYYSYDEIGRYLRHLELFKNPDTLKQLAIVERIGESYEGRPMHLVKISSDHRANKPIIFMEAGIHGREWTAPAAALYMMYQLVENYTYNAHVLENIDFYIIPVSNPDGYEYSRVIDRMWRKTRSFNEGAFGVDGNRNFGFHWGEEGTSRNPNSQIYIGPYPFSEPETRNIRDAGRKYSQRINMFVSIHAYGPYIVYPWSYKRTDPAPQAALMEKIGHEASKAIRRYNGTHFTVGNSAYLMYEAAGGSDDYFKGELGVDLSFTVELSANGAGSFITPTNKLLGVVAEAYEGFKVMADRASKYQPL